VTGDQSWKMFHLSLKPARKLVLLAAQAGKWLDLMVEAADDG
jgi:hypothetical protein